VHVHVHVHGLKRDFPPMRFRRATLDWSRPYVLGVVNVTPD
jgi:hypothetical protein